MSVDYTEQRIRMALACGTDTLTDKFTGETPVFWNGTDISLELLFRFGDNLVAVANYTSITAELKPIDDRLGAALMSKTVALVDLDPTVTEETWADDTAQHVAFRFTNAETELALGGNAKQFWLVFSAITTDTPEKRVTLGAGTITVNEDGTPSTDQNPVQGGNVLPFGATYDGSGEYVLGVTLNKTYRAAFGANDTSLVNDLETLTVGGIFDAQDTFVTLHGTPSALVTFVIRGDVFLNAEQLDGRFASAADVTARMAKSANLSDVASVATAQTNLDVYAKAAVDALVALRNLKSANLSDVANVATAQTNLDVYAKAAVDALVALRMLKTANLSDVANVATAQTNLDVYAKAAVDAAVALRMLKTNNLSDVASVATAQTNLDVYAKAAVDAALALRALKTANLSDLPSPSTALTNLGGFPTTGGAITGASSVKASATPLTVWLDSTGTLGGVLETVKVQRRSASGLPTAGFGVQLNFALDTTTTLRTAANINCFWANPTDANRTAYVQFTNRVLVSGVYGEAEVLGLSDAANVCIGFGYPATETSGMSYGLIFGASIPPTANPSNAFALFYENTGHTFRYRGDTANEGAGANNYLHNRAISATPGAGLYTLTTSFAQVDFGSGVKMSVALPTAGTYLIMAQVCFVGGGTAGDAMEAQLHDDTGAAYLGFPIRWQPYTTGAPQGASPLLAVATVTGASTISVYAKNATAARGTVIPTYCNLVAVRLY